MGSKKSQPSTALSKSPAGGRGSLKKKRQTNETTEEHHTLSSSGDPLNLTIKNTRNQVLI